MDESLNQLIDPAKFKQELGIKVEPLSIGDLVELAAFESCEIERTTVHFNQHEIATKQIKIEVKKENEGKSRRNQKQKESL